MTRAYKSALILLVLFSAGCALFKSYDDAMQSWVGKDFEEIQLIWGAPHSGMRSADGETVYQYHREQIDPSCFHYWIVDQHEVIKDFYYEGECRSRGGSAPRIEQRRHVELPSQATWGK